MIEDDDPTDDGTETPDAPSGVLQAASSLAVTPAAVTPAAGGDYSGVLKQLNDATQRLKDQRSGLTMQQKISALLTGYAQPSTHTGWQSGVANAAANLQAQTLAKAKADATRDDLISKYDLMAAHYGAQNQASAARTAELAQAAKDKGAAAAAKASQGTIQVLPAMFPGAPVGAVLKGFNPDGTPFVKNVPVGTPGSVPATGPTTGAPPQAALAASFPIQHYTGQQLADKYGLTGYDPNAHYSYTTAGVEAGKVVEDKPGDALEKYGVSNLTGPALLAALPAPKAAEVQAILDGRLLAPTTGSRGKDGAELLQLASAADPTFDAGKAKAKFATRMDYAPGGKSGQQFLAIDTVMNHLDKLNTDFSNLGNTDVPIANTFKNAALAATGHASPTKAEQTATAASNEMMKVFRGTGTGSTKDIADWRQTIPVNGSPDQQAGAISGGLDLVVGRLKPKVDQWNQTMGENRSVLSFISPSARATFMKLDPTYQLTDDDKKFLNQQEIDKRTKARATAPAAAAAGPSSAAAVGGAPPVPNARKAPDGNWYVPDPTRPGKYLKVGS